MISHFFSIELQSSIFFLVFFYSHPLVLAILLEKNFITEGKKVIRNFKLPSAHRAKIKDCREESRKREIVPCMKRKNSSHSFLIHLLGNGHQYRQRSPTQKKKNFSFPFLMRITEQESCKRTFFHK
jgi:hypothetical protein